MANDATIDSLKLEVSSSSVDASNGLETLTKSLKKLQRATGKGLGLTAVVNELKTANTSLSTSLDGFEKAAQTLSKFSGLRISSSIGNQITAISTAIQGANFGGGADKMQSLVEALEPLKQLGKTNLSSYVTALKKLPETFSELSKIDMGAFTAKIKELATALKPLGDEMQKVANGFSAFPVKIQKLIASTNKLSTVNNKASTSYFNLYAKLKMVKTAVMGIARTIASWISLSSDYTETMNLFTVSMGQYAEEAYNYAQTVSNLMGIDPAEWMNSQGTFMTLVKGFGVVGDRANVMSQQLTQLGYDLSSFFNINVDDAMTKLQSGISGELEPLRRLGFDLSQAKLEATALSLGIDKAVSSMTQAEKAELRYYAILTQVTDAHGDMARTLDAPANQLRILKAQVTQLGRALGNFFIPLLNKVLPYVIGAVKVLREVLDVFMGLLGIELAEVDFGADSITSATDDVVRNLEDAQTEAKKLKSYMLGFDELNVFNSDDSSSDLEDLLGTGFDFELPTYDFTEGVVATKLDEIVQKMRDWLGITEDVDSWSELMDTRFGSILKSVTAIGIAILTWKISTSLSKFIKNDLPALKALVKTKGFQIGLGVTLAVTGLAIGATVIQDAITEGLQSVNVFDLVSSATLIVLGGTLIGNAFGKAMMGGAIAGIVIGVAGLGVALYDAIKNELNITNGLVIAFSAALIGAGIGYLINGALGAAMGVMAGVVVGGAIAGALWIIQNVEDTVAKIFGIVSAATLAVGAILAFTGANIPLGIGLMVVGAVAMGSQIAMNSNALSDEVKGTIAIITTAVSVALLAVGAILAFTGANIPLGIGLMVGGALTMGASIIPNWDLLPNEVRNTISTILAIAGAAAMAIGLILVCTGVGIPLGIGLILAGATSLGTAIGLNWNAIVNKLKEVCNKISEIATDLWEGIVSVWNGVADWFNDKVINPVKNAFTNIWTKLKDGATSAWSGIKSVFSNVATFFKDAFSKAWEKVKNVFSTGGKIFDGIKDGIVNAFKTVVNAIITGINKVVAVPFNAINSVLQKIRDINIFGLQPFKDIKTINVPQIPLLAQGGFPDVGQLFVAREAGAELVGNIGGKTAVMNNDQIVASVSAGVYQAVLAALGGSKDDEGNTNIVINLDGEKIYENQQRIARGRGYNMGMGVFSFG